MTAPAKHKAARPGAAAKGVRGVSQRIWRVLSLVPLLNRLAGPYRRVLYVSMAISFLVAFADGALALLIMPFIAQMIGTATGADTGLASWMPEWLPDMGSEKGLVFGMAMVAIGLVVREGMSGLAKTLTFFTTAQIVTHIRVQITERLLGAKTAYIDTLASGAPIQIVVNESRTVMQGLRAFVAAAAALLACVLLVALLLSISPLLLAAMVGVGLIALPLKYQYSLILHKLLQRNLTASIDLMDNLTETLRGLRQIRVQNRKEEFSERLRATSVASERVFFLANAMQANEPVVLHLFAILAIGAVFCGVYWAGAMPLAQMAVFFFVMYRLVPQVAALSGQLNGILTAEPGIRRVAEMYFADARKAERTGGEAIAGNAVRSLELREVGLTYRDGRVALRDVSMQAKRGEFVAIVGESGAGKSSILHLLLGMYDARGQVLIDGRPIDELDLRSIRDCFWLVPQDIHVIRSRVDEFVRGGQSGIPEHALAAAARLAVVDDVIAGLPKGFRTEIGTGGHLISGGQRQRLALAQAFAKNPSVVLLDEATSALDSLTEHKVFDSLAEWSKDRIVVLVTHRVMNLQRADRIYVLQDGSVIEHGNWRSLLALGGTFASMVSRQQSTAQVA